MAKSPIIGALILITISRLTYAASGESSFTPTSYKVPIGSITLVNSSTNASTNLYQCSGTTESTCLVDILDNTALAALAAQVSSVTTGTYDQIAVNNCPDHSASGYSVLVKGSKSISGTTYFTTSSAIPVSSVSSDLDYTTTSFTGCKATWNLPSTLTISTGDTVKMSVYVSPSNIGWMLTNSGSSVVGGCKSSGSKSVCVGYPNLVPVLSSFSTDPTLEIYNICEGSSCASGSTFGGEVMILVDSSGNVLGGYTRMFFDPSSTPLTFGFSTAFKTAAKNADNTYTLLSYGSTGSPSGDVKFSAFSRISSVNGTASGTYTNGAGASSTTYGAKRVQ